MLHEIFNQDFRLKNRIEYVVGTSCLQLYFLDMVKLFLTRTDPQMAIHVLISSRQDYCDAL